MRPIVAVAFALLSVLAGGAAVAQAPAEPSPVTPGVSAALLVGYGFKDDYHTGYGARVGYTFPAKLYVGGTFVYHLGTLADDGVGGSIRSNMTYFGGEVGYALSDGPFEIRPYLGVGMAQWWSWTNDIVVPGFGWSGRRTSESALAFWPGVAVTYSLGSAFIGADARGVLMNEREAPKALATYLFGGMRF